MRSSTLVVERGLSIKGLLKWISVEAEIVKAVRQLGYDPDKQDLTIEGYGLDRYIVHFGRSYVGVWDTNRKTFVD